MAKKKVTFRIDETIHEKLLAKAKNDDETCTKLVEKFIQEGLINSNKENSIDELLTILATTANEIKEKLSKG